MSDIPRPLKSAKKVILRDKPTKETEIRMKANEKLIFALEQEEKRLLDNERRYAQEVKRLQLELDDSKVLLESSTAKVGSWRDASPGLF